MKSSIRLAALGACAMAAWAQSTPAVVGPVTGFIFGAPGGALRPMLGIPGAAYLGRAVAGDLRVGAVAPDGSAALAVVRGGQVTLFTGLRTTPASAGVAGAIADADRFAWAADSGSAALYASASGQAQILTGLAKSPVAGSPIDLASLPGPVTALGFDGQRLIMGVSGDSGGIYLASASSPAQRIARAGSPSAIVVAGAGLYFADSQARQIWQVANYATTPAAMLFAGDGDIEAPAGLQLSADGQRLFSADAGSLKLTVYSIAARTAIESIPLDFAPTRLDRFGDTSVFLMNSGDPAPFYVARDGGAGKAAVYFVPASNPSPRLPR